MGVVDTVPEVCDPVLLGDVPPVVVGVEVAPNVMVVVGSCHVQ